MNGGSVATSMERGTVRKLRIRIIPFLFLLYIVAFLDRINIGFAALTMNKELAITPRQFGLLTGVFFIGYFFFEIPSNLLLHKIGARIWIARILLSWGTVAIVAAAVHDVQQLYIVRFLLGVAEAGFFPGVVLYLTYWFREREQAEAIALFMTALPVATVVGAPLSGFILDRIHWFGLSSWRWLLILEGLPAIVCGILTFLYLPNSPTQAPFLTQDEKRWIEQELKREEAHKKERHQISATQSLCHPRVWHLAGIGFSLFIGMYSVIFWMPQAVKALSGHYTNTLVGLLVMVPYAMASVAMIIVSRSSDRKLERKYHTAVPVIIAAVALMLLGVASVPLISIILLALVVAGGFSANGPFWSMPSEFLTGASAASGIALINSVANLGGFVGPYAIGFATQKTGSLIPGLAVASVSLFVSAGLILFLPKTHKAEF